MSDSTVRFIKKDKANIWRTHALSFCRQAKRVVTGQNRLLIRMECALILWIADCGEKNVLLDASLIRTKAKTLYDTLAIEGGDGDEEESGEGGDGDSKESQPGTSQGGEMSSSRRKGFVASKGWFERFKKRSGLRSLVLHAKLRQQTLTQPKGTWRRDSRRSSKRMATFQNRCSTWMKLQCSGSICHLVPSSSRKKPGGQDLSPTRTGLPF